MLSRALAGFFSHDTCIRGSQTSKKIDAKTWASAGTNEQTGLTIHHSAAGGHSGSSHPLAGHPAWAASGARCMPRICNVGTTSIADVEADLAAARDGILPQRLGVVRTESIRRGLHKVVHCLRSRRTSINVVIVSVNGFHRLCLKCALYSRLNPD